MTERLTDEALIHRAVLAWIKDDAPIGIKMQMTPDLANKLSERISRAAPADDLRAENERMRGMLREARDWNWIDFEEMPKEDHVCLPQLVDLNNRIIAALSQKGGAA